MKKGRLEAFSDGVIAIIITIMVLELKTPHTAEISALVPLLPVFISYILSFIYVGIYWNNHHHLLHSVHHIGGSALWANLHLLFWLSLLPFVTAWMGENHFSTWPLVLYGVVLFMAAVAYYVLTQVLITQNGKDSPLAIAIGKDFKGKISIVAYLMGIASSFLFGWMAFGIYVLVAFMWLVPDQRLERSSLKDAEEL